MGSLPQLKKHNVRCAFGGINKKMIVLSVFINNSGVYPGEMRTQKLPLQ